MYASAANIGVYIRGMILPTRQSRKQATHHSTTAATNTGVLIFTFAIPATKNTAAAIRAHSSEATSLSAGTGERPSISA